MKAEQLRAGDVVLVEGIVVAVWPNSVDVMFLGEAQVSQVKLEAIASVTRRWAAGDRVISPGPLTVGTPGVIVALHGDFAWICLDTGVHATQRIEDLERPE